MREILFRGKRMRDGTWIYGQVFIAHNIEHDDEKETYLVWNDAYCNTTKGTVNFSEVDPDTVGQFTGLLDKNGSKIFEGDIVAVFYDCKIQFDGVVQYNNGAFVIKGYSMEYLARENMTFVVECSKWDKPEFLNP